MLIDATLAPLFYQYGLGSIVFLLGIYAGWRAGIWGRGKNRWLALMVVGWGLMFVVQGGLQLYAGRAAGTDTTPAAVAKPSPSPRGGQP